MPVKNGDTVKVHYRGTLADGSEFDSSEGRDPLQFVMGRKMLIPGFEKAVMGLEVGDKTTVTIPPEDAYGEREEEQIIPLPLDQVPDDMDPEVGMVVQLQTNTGAMIDAVVKEITEDKMMLDTNHPLAGEALTFEIEVVEIA